jgi:tryptophanyl-tRNA synthetase
MDLPSPKPALIHSKFLTSLQGAGGKMSASDANSAIYMSDTPKQIKTKINTKAFSGGQETLELHREKGGNPDIDVPYQYISYFEDDDAKLTKLAEDYRKGEVLTGEMKKECVDIMTTYVKQFQEARAKVTDEVLDEFLRPRKLEWKGNPNPTKPKLEQPAQDTESGGPMLDADGKPMTKNAMKKAAKMAEVERKKKEKEAAAAAKQ